MLKKKVIVITGGAGLLGAEFSRSVCKAGGIVIVADLNMSAATSVANDLTHDGYQAVPAEIDITDRPSIDALIMSVDKTYGRIDGLVNNAYPRNQNYGRKLEDVTYNDFCENIGMHLGGYFLMSQRFAMYFKSKGSGSIVNMGSIYGTMAPRFDIYEGTDMTMPVEYSAIKSAVIQLSKYFSQHFKKNGVRCNTLSPGGIFDHQSEKFTAEYKKYSGQKGMLDVQDICGALIFLLSDSSKYLHGQNIIIDDGFSL